MKKFKLDRRCVFFSIISLLIVSLFAFGSASWTMAITKDFDSGTINKVDLDEGKVVAYINDNTEANQYRSVEQALAKAKELGGGEVYVIPGTNPTIKVDCEVASGVKLILPYKDKEYHIASYKSYKDDTAAIQNNTFADATEAGVNTYRKNSLLVKDGVKVTNNGEITVGGILGLGYANQRPSGHVAKDYCEIVLGSKTSIINNGTINTYGYIKESSTKNGSSVDNKSGAKLYTPLVIYDFRGGSYSTSCIDGIAGLFGGGDQTMPFNVFDFANVQVNDVFNSGSELHGWALVYTSDGVTSAESTVIASSSGLFRLKSGKLTMKYTPADHRYTISDTKAGNTTRDKICGTDVKIEGNMDISSLTIKVNVSIDTSKMFFPMSYKFNINIASGTTNVNNKVKFLAGSVLTVSEGATANINSSTIFYQNYIPAIEPGEGNATLYPKLGSARFIVNGNLKIDTSFGGFIEANSSTGKITATSNFSSGVSSIEVLKNGSSGGLFGAGDTEKRIEQSLALISYNASSVKERILIKNTTFDSNLGDVNYWSASVAESSIDAQLTADTTETNRVGTIMNFTLYLLPSEDFFDMQKGVTWSFKKKTTSWGQTKWVDTTEQTFKNDNLNASLTITSKPSNSIIGTKQTDTYRVYCEVYKNDGTLVSKYVEISVSSK